MARARNIKPSFFVNEQVSDNCPLGRLLFIGLWTMADYKGDLEWKEKTLKIQILPWDECSVKQLAINLDKSGLIRFYSDGEKIYLNIPNFEKHQNPHKNEREKGSDVPAYSDAMRQLVDLKEITINRDLSGLKWNDSTSDRADSLLLIPDSPYLNPESATASAAACSETFSSKPPADESPIFISIPTNKFNTAGEERPITENKITEWQAVYPAVDVRQTIIRIRSWVINNPAKRKTFGGIFKFIDTWLAKEQNSGGGHAANQLKFGPSASPAKMPHADVVRGQARRAYERLNGENGFGAVHENGRVISQQG